MGMFADLVNKAARAATGGGGNAPKYTYDPNTQMYTQMANGGKVGSASKRADGIAQRGKTRGKVI